jgi:hypothetical protein
LRVTRFFLGGASALAARAAGSTFARTSGADWAFGFDTIIQIAERRAVSRFETDVMVAPLLIALNAWLTGELAGSASEKWCHYVLQISKVTRLTSVFRSSEKTRATELCRPLGGSGEGSRTWHYRKMRPCIE